MRKAVGSPCIQIPSDLRFNRRVRCARPHRPRVTPPPFATFTPPPCTLSLIYIRTPHLPHFSTFMFSSRLLPTSKLLLLAAPSFNLLHRLTPTVTHITHTTPTPITIIRSMASKDQKFPPQKQDTQPGKEHLMDPTPQSTTQDYKPANKLLVCIHYIRNHLNLENFNSDPRFWNRVRWLWSPAATPASAGRWATASRWRAPPWRSRT